MLWQCTIWPTYQILGPAFSITDWNKLEEKTPQNIIILPNGNLAPLPKPGHSSQPQNITCCSHCTRALAMDSRESTHYTDHHRSIMPMLWYMHACHLPTMTVYRNNLKINSNADFPVKIIRLDAFIRSWFRPQCVTFTSPKTSRQQTQQWRTLIARYKSYTEKIRTYDADTQPFNEAVNLCRITSLISPQTLYKYRPQPVASMPWAKRLWRHRCLPPNSRKYKGRFGGTTLGTISVKATYHIIFFCSWTLSNDNRG